MFRHLLQATAALAVAAFAVPALAAPPTITSVPFTSGTSTFNECTYNDGVHFYPCQLAHAWNNTTGAPVPLAVDPTSLFLGVTIENLPPGAATAANQLGAANFMPAQVPVTATASQLVAARAGRRTVTVYNTGSTPIYVGAAGVTTSTGFPIPVGNSLTISFAGALFGIGTATTTASLYEIY